MTGDFIGNSSEAGVFFEDVIPLRAVGYSVELGELGRGIYILE